MRRGVFCVVGFIVLFVFLLSSVYGQEDEVAEVGAIEEAQVTGFDEVKTLNWLFNETSTSTKDETIQALSIIALVSGGKDVSSFVSRLEERKSAEEACWPAEGCKIKETVYASLALEKVGRDVSDSVEWLKEGLIPGLKVGDWQIVIESKGNGTCEFKWDNQTPKKYTIEENEVKEAKNKFYVSISEFAPALLNKVMPKVTVDCSPLPKDANVIVALVYKSGNTFSLLDSVSGASEVTFTIPNSCFSVSKGGACNYDSTLYSTWALVEAGESIWDLGTLVYLESGLKASTIDLAVLTRILEKAALLGDAVKPSSFESELVNRQKTDGSWDGNVFATAYSILALSPTDKSSNVLSAKNYLQGRWSPAGSWSQDQELTAISLIALKGDILEGFVGEAPSAGIGGLPFFESICDDLIDDDGDGLIDCGDPDCSDDAVCLCENGICDSGEQCFTDQTLPPDCGGECPPCEEIPVGIEINCNDGIDDDDDGLIDCEDTDCTEDINCILVEEEVCVSDFDCGPGEECKDGECVSVEERRGLGFVWFIIILLLLILGGALVYFKFIRTGKFDLSSLFRKKKPKGPTFEEFKRAARPARPAERPVAPARPVARPAKKAKEEDELEKSLREAEKLLHGK